MKLEETMNGYISYLSSGFPYESTKNLSGTLSINGIVPEGNEGRVSVLAARHSLLLLNNRLLTVENMLLRDIAEGL